MMHSNRRNVGTIKTERQATMQIVVSLSLLSAALFAILSQRYNANTMHWAIGTAGMILGFWLRR
jgi:hypothetical protein